MLNLDHLINFKKYLAKPGKKIKLKDFDTDYDGKTLSKRDAEALLSLGLQKLSETQDMLYAHNRYSVLIIFQAMDAAGKDSAVKHVMTGFNPQGVRVYSFKSPSEQELDHDYLWRHYKALPSRGEICIFNRSHYENVLVTRVHPEYILNEHLPGIDSVSKITDSFWKERYKQISRFERNIAENGTIILKFFLHISKKEQKKRFLERIDDATKNWKFSLGDLKERTYWNEYQRAYEEAIEETSKDYAPWFIVPADDKWCTRLIIAGIISKQFQKLSLHYPTLNESQKAELKKARLQLMSEKEGNNSAEKVKKKKVQPKEVK
ncbi:MAG TPA: polyphosphate kinase 2 family protein [Cyclobacteriaceae bacterium]|nr:polyphosphate kinase 2 family protein [Cyclobacteriaceae bacterium]